MIAQNYYWIWLVNGQGYRKIYFFLLFLLSAWINPPINEKVNRDKKTDELLSGILEIGPKFPLSLE